MVDNQLVEPQLVVVVTLNIFLLCIYIYLLDFKLILDGMDNLALLYLATALYIFTALFYLACIFYSLAEVCSLIVFLSRTL